jgi:glycerol-3-phosphate O-acyltransferase
LADRPAADVGSKDPPGAFPPVGLSLSRDQREYVRSEVIRRALEEQKELCRRSRDLNLEVIINDAVYQEQERLRGDKSREGKEQKRFWNKVAGEFHRVTEAEREEILARIVDMYVSEIMGYFNPVLYSLAGRIIPWGLKAMLSRFSPASFLKWASSRLTLEENLTVSGPVDDIRALAGKATLIMTPTHLSNLDSVAIGIGLYQSRLPPFTYGAGLNLFSNPVVSFFMNNLGAYKVDRRKKNGIYKSALKQYATLSMELGQHNLFFPGGTRNRAGDIEQKLKLGLLGCGVNVYVSNLLAEKPHPDLFVIPCTISYGLVLEAQSLIEEHLQETGKSRYIRVRSDFSRPMRVLNFWRNLRSMESKIHMHFGDPIDLFGNRVDRDGVSRDAHGRAIDRRKYVERDGKPVQSPQRDQEFTRELGRSILASFRRNNVILPTQVAAFAVFDLMRRRHPHYDLYRLLRTEGKDHAVPTEEALVRIADLSKRLLEMEGRGEIILSGDLREASAGRIFETASKHFKSFHSGEVLRTEGSNVYTQNIKLLYYYRNRLDHYGLDR